MDGRIRELRNKFDKGPCLKCGKCFECCTAILLTKDEKKRMMVLLKKKGYKQPPEGKGKENCEYLDGDGRCVVYEERPIICRAFGVLKQIPGVNIPFECTKNRECATIPTDENMLRYRKQCNVKNKMADSILSSIK